MSCIIQERERYDGERAADRGAIERLEREKRELRNEAERVRGEQEAERGRYQRQISMLRAEKKQLEEEKLHIEGEKMQVVQKVRNICPGIKHFSWLCVCLVGAR